MTTNKDAAREKSRVLEEKKEWKILFDYARKLRRNFVNKKEEE